MFVFMCICSVDVAAHRPSSLRALNTTVGILKGKLHCASEHFLNNRDVIYPQSVCLRDKVPEDDDPQDLEPRSATSVATARAMSAESLRVMVEALATFQG